MERRHKLFLVAVAATTLFAVAVSATQANSRRLQQEKDESYFKNTTGIVFSREAGFKEIDGSLYENDQFIVSTSTEVARLVSTIHLQHKARCKCAHLNDAVFETPSGLITVSFCGHCFDIVAGVNGAAQTRYYRMPKEFYAEFERLTDGEWQPKPLIE